jgi:hypothetical protein
MADGAPAGSGWDGDGAGFAPFAGHAPFSGLAPGSAPAPAAPVPGAARDAVAAAESAAAGSTQLGVAVLDRATGELAVGGRGAEQDYTASLSKLVLAVDMLERRRFDGLVVAEPDLALLRRALGPSDDNAMNVLWTRFDGAGSAGRVSARLHLAATSAPQNPSQWGEMQISAADYVRIWGHVLTGMPAEDRDLLLSAMDAAPPTATDGFDQAFGLLSSAVDGPGAAGAVAKQGWMCCFSGQYYLHSAGAVGPDRRFLMTLLTRQPSSAGWAAARQELDRIATAAVQALC